MSALSPPFPLLSPSRLAPLLRLPSFVRLPGTPSASHAPGALLRAAALELSVLVAHLALYPTGLAAERPADEADTAGPSAPASPRLPLAPLPPVVLLHGFADNRSVFVLLRRALLRDADGTARRRTVVSLNYSPLTCDIRAAAELLGRHVEEVRRRTGADRVDVVGHSLGGLIARYHVQRLGGDAAVRTLVTLGTPHSGTRVARPADVHPIVRQMRPGSPVIEELGRPAPGCRTRFVAVRSDLDQIMVPTSTARLDHPDLRVENVLVTGIGHLALPVHPTVTSLVREALAAPAGQGADTRAYEAPGAPESAGGTVA
ncbi:alpha/beta fold hydrolase [Streptomyces albidoflavus]|uniref:esterase/lipase family protein n=1 Tax=Streptomyces TaxID=1883 RepID=UPI001A4C3C02|nr:alpha/beta fold hydrolase [Streptomyces albidoflavus]MBL0800940.1 alpha/beta hydrolase [Streptomyces albidoflavus]MCR0987728.1 alpha/beta fold hydrolase [Streptomyces albidoflavus]